MTVDRLGERGGGGKGSAVFLLENPRRCFRKLLTLVGGSMK